METILCLLKPGEQNHPENHLEMRCSFPLSLVSINVTGLVNLSLDERALCSLTVQWVFEFPITHSLLYWEVGNSPPSSLSFIFLLIKWSEYYSLMWVSEDGYSYILTVLCRRPEQLYSRFGTCLAHTWPGFGPQYPIWYLKHYLE